MNYNEAMECLEELQSLHPDIGVDLIAIIKQRVAVLELALEKACKLQAYNSRMVKSPDNWKEGFLAQAQAELSEVK